jgi:acyl-coenzyme A thioesterase PaaI-like protein
MEIDGSVARMTAAVGLTTPTHLLRSGTSGTSGTVTGEAVGLNQGRTQQLWRGDITSSDAPLLAHGEVRLHNVAGQAPYPAETP